MQKVKNAMARLQVLVLWIILGISISEAAMNGHSCRRQIIDLRRQHIGTLHVIVPDLETDCLIELHPQWGHSVVLSILQYNVPAHHLLSIEDSDGYKISLLNQGLFIDNKKSIISERTMKIRYTVDKKYMTQSQRINETELEDNSTELEVNDTLITIMNATSPSTGFGFFYFTFNEVGNGPCTNMEFACQNGKCLPKSYACSGYNRCGDNSDNKECGPLPTQTVASSKVSKQTLLYYIGASFAVLFITLSTIVCVIKSRKGRNTDESNPPLQSVSANVPPEELPRRVPAEAASPSMCSRVQNFFQREDSRRAEDIPQTTLPTERFEVPSMYPSLQPSAPEEYASGGGRENRGFSRGERE